MEDYKVGGEKEKKMMQHLSEVIKPEIPVGMGFCVLVFDYGPNGNLFYASSASREDMLRALEEFISKQKNA